MSGKGGSVQVSVIVPARNEAATIGPLVEDLRRMFPPPLEILVIDDCSDDGTARVAREAGARVVRLSAHGGKGAALKRGLADATGQLVLTIDADGQDVAQDLQALLEEARRGADMVIGSRFLGRFEPGAISGLNLLGTRFFNGLIRIATGVVVTDSQAGVRCFRKSLVDRMCLRSTEYEIETEMLLEAIRLSARIAEVPVRRLPRKSGSTSFSRFRHGLRILVTILRYRLP
jgi:glycosyltransferase involved in cell wall biosynthesis